MVGSRNSASNQREFDPVLEALACTGAHVIVLDLRGLSDATDYFVIATGTSDTHVRALAERTIESMKDAGAGRSSRVVAEDGLIDFVA